VLTLAIDNSLDFLNIAIGTEKGLVEERNGRAENRSSEVVAVRVKNLLDDYGFTPHDLSRIVVTRGPGSFTGVRVALAFCKGLSEGLEIPLIGVPTPDVLAVPFSFLTESYVCPLIDAKKGEVFFSLYWVSATGVVTSIGGHHAIGKGEISGRLLTPCLCVGSGAVAYRPELETIDGVTVAAGIFQRVVGETLLRCGTSLFASGYEDHQKPIYGRKSEAEIRFGFDVG
jgi:tRNA threonylcarbamoyladenosine biosynthesis protein TsaB